MQWGYYFMKFMFYFVSVCLKREYWAVKCISEWALWNSSLNMNVLGCWMNQIFYAQQNSENGSSPVCDWFCVLKGCGLWTYYLFYKVLFFVFVLLASEVNLILKAVVFQAEFSFMTDFAINLYKNYILEIIFWIVFICYSFLE